MPATNDTLTAGQVQRLKPGPTAIDVRDGHTRGLLVTVLPSGKKQFAIRYRYRGKQRRFVLGDFPQLSLAAARKRAKKAQVQIADGGDPAGERRAATAPRTDTVAALAEDYLRKHARKFKKSATEDERILSTNVLPVLGDRSVRDLTRRDVRALVEDIDERGAGIMANRTLALVRKLFNFGVDHDWLDANPASRIRPPAREVSRERVLDDDEIRRIWRLLEHVSTTAERSAPGRKAAADADDPFCPIKPVVADVVRLRLLTAQRGGEIVRMRWKDVDADLSFWTIPPTDTKNGRAHRVPLTDRARTIIESQPRTDDQPLVFSGSGQSVADAAKKGPAKVGRVLGLNDFRGHDLRRTAATRMAAAGIPRDDISAVLNHTPAGAVATRVYDRYDRDTEKRVALDTWDRCLTAILNGKRTSKVIPISKGRS